MEQYEYMQPYRATENKKNCRGPQLEKAIGTGECFLLTVENAGQQ